MCVCVLNCAVTPFHRGLSSILPIDSCNRILDDDCAAYHVGIILLDLVLLHVLVGFADGLGFDGDEQSGR